MKPKKGFTLIEAILYTAILFVVVSTIVSFLLWSMKTNAKAKAMREVLDNAQRTMEIMKRDIKEAKSIYTPTTNSNQVSLETVKYLLPGEDSSYVDFYLADGTVFMKKESQSPIALTSDRVEAKNLVFTQISTAASYPSIKIGFEVEYKNPGNKPEYSASIGMDSTVSLRNY